MPDPIVGFSIRRATLRRIDAERKRRGNIPRAVILREATEDRYKKKGTLHTTIYKPE